MKKIITVLTALCCMASFAGCGNTAATETGSAGTTAAQSADTETFSELEPFNTSGTITQTVLYEENGVKITANSLSYTDNAANLDLTIENTSAKDLSITSETMGYSCNSVNGYMVNDGYLLCDVASGKTANDTMNFDMKNLRVYGIDEIADIEVGFTISDDDYNSTYSGPRQLKTSLAATHDYSRENYQESIQDPAVKNALNYDVIYSAPDSSYDKNGVKLLSDTLIESKEGEVVLALEMENTTDKQVNVSTTDICINDLEIEDSLWSTVSINPKKRCAIEINLTDVFDRSYWDTYGLGTIGSVSVSLTLKDSGNNDIASATPVKVTIPGAAAQIDSTGQEVYNSNGVRVIYKTILADSFDLSDDLYAFFLIENNSGKKLNFEPTYGSLSVNGFMMNGLTERTETENGRSAVMKVELPGSDLEKNSIASAENITQMEFTLEIKEDYTDIDTPKIQINLNA